LAYGDIQLPTKAGKMITLNKLGKRSELKVGYYNVKILCENNDLKKIFAFSPKHV
jgi:hypothetical protein